MTKANKIYLERLRKNDFVQRLFVGIKLPTGFQFDPQSIDIKMDSKDEWSEEMYFIKSRIQPNQLTIRWHEQFTDDP